MAYPYGSTCIASGIEYGILLKPINLAEHKDGSSRVKIDKGELLVGILNKDRIPRHEYPHNYFLYGEPTVTLYDDGTRVCPLEEAEFQCLAAVPERTLRFAQYTTGKLEWVPNLRVGDMVFFHLAMDPKARPIIKGKIRYFGKIEGYEGFMFGIEIIDPNFRGKGTTDGSPYFNCGYKNGVYVAMDKIVNSDSSLPNNTGKDSSRDYFINEAIRIEPKSHDRPVEGPAGNTRNRGKGTSGDGKTLLDKAKDLGHKIAGLANVTSTPIPSDVPSKFSLGDHVVLQSAKGGIVKGVVRWTGPFRMSREAGGIVMQVVGIETSRVVNHEEEFPGLCYNVTGSHGQHLFIVACNHGRIYVAEQVVLTEDEYQDIKRKEKRESEEAKEAKKWGVSVEEYIQQRKLLSEKNAEKDQIDGPRKRDPTPPPLITTNCQTANSLEDKLRLNNELETDRPHTHEHASYNSQSSDDMNDALKPTYPRHDDHHSPSLQSHYNNPQQYHQYQPHLPPQYSVLSTGHTPPMGDTGDKPCHPSIPSDPSDFTVGTRVYVQMRYGPPHYGVIQWIGTLPDICGWYAGVELDEHLDKCSDGSFNGRRYFTCPPGRGVFCVMSALLLDKRFMESHQLPAARKQDLKNPLSDVPQHDDSDTPGGPELFSKYIGDYHGIQGHHNSCYLDATVFGLFALSDSFDELLLLEEPYTDIGKTIKHILWKGIINPLRRYGVARFESILELHNKLEVLGKMEGANRDEKDPEEFLNLLFEKILHIKPFLSIKRPFGVENEFFVQLFFEIEENPTAPPNTEKLINKMFHEQNISFTTVPSKLLLQMPRFGKKFNKFNKTIPSRKMDVKSLLDRGLGLGSEEIGSVVSRFSTMQLLSVICIETSHYVCFTRTKDKWLFHDSMADRIHDTFNIPRVTDVSEELNHWVYNPDNHQKLLSSSPRDIPECVRRFTQDIYMCVYTNPDLDRYGVPYEDMPSSEYSFAAIKNVPGQTSDECDKLKSEVTQLKKALEKREKELVESTKENQVTIEELRTAHLEEEKRHKSTKTEFDRYRREMGRILETRKLDKLEESWRISNKDIRITAQELGKGGWGAVVVGVFREQKVAVKQLYNIIKSDHNLAIMNREINTMSRLRHPNLLLFIGAVLDHPSGNPLIITEIMDTSLRHAYEKGQLTNDDTSKLSILRDTASGLNYLHCHHDEIIHRDVSSANVLLESRGTKKWRAKLSDFGSANIARQAYTQQMGAAVYSAPEAMPVALCDDEEQLQTTKMDAYSYGVLSCEVMCCQFPESRVVFRTMLSRVHTSSPSIGQMIQDCMNKSPQQRPTMAHVIHCLDDLLQK